MTNFTNDLERQNDIDEDFIQYENIGTPLRSILRKQDSSIVIDENVIEIKLMKICYGLLNIIIFTPIVFLDLYFGFTENFCSIIEPDDLSINLKLYLLVSGFTNIIKLIGLLVLLYWFSPIKMINYKYYYLICLNIIHIINILISIFDIIWTILGAVVFWFYIYGHIKCNKQFSTYLFISLIIKIVCNIILLQTSIKNKK